jgi:hypothetical protein
MEINNIMGNTMDWFAKLIRIAGVNFPVSASLVQLQAEIDSAKIAAHLEKLEDPISFLHEDVPAASKEIYQKLSTNDSVNLDFDEAFYTKYSRPLAALAKNSFISKNSVIGSRIPRGITLIDPMYIMYMCALAEDKNKMQEIVKIVDSCEVGKWLDGEKLKIEIGLPKYVIHAVFEIYAAKGYGILSKTVGSCQYMGNA